MTKLIVVLGVTGKQGGSVARRFAKDPDFRVRGVTRDSSSDAAKALTALGIELVAADIDDVESLKIAFAGANLIFSVTNYWEPFFRPDGRAKAEQQGISVRRYAYDVEYQQGKNIADAAASVVKSLVDNGLLASTLSHARKCSKDRYKEVYHFDSKADVFPDYVNEKHPELAKKVSCIHTGYFIQSYQLAPWGYFAKQSDGSFVMSFTTPVDAPAPHLDVISDTGNFVYAVAQRKPGGQYMAEGESCSWTEFMKTWSKTTGKQGTYKQISTEEMIEASPDKPFGAEVADMFSYTGDPGYDGGVDLIKAADMEKEGIACPMTTLEEYFEKEDWSMIFNQ